MSDPIAPRYSPIVPCIQYQIRLLIALSVILWTLSDAASVGAQDEDNDRPQYVFDVTLNLGSQKASVHQTVHYVNRSAIPLSELVFQVPPARYDAFALSEATARGQAVNAHLDGEVLSLPLDADLNVGDRITATLTYSLTIPSPGDIRFGYLSGVVAMGNWFPILAIIDERGWVRQQYVPIGDPWVAENADYRVSLTLDREAKIAHTGRLVAAEGTTFTFEASDVRDFALAVSERYKTLHQQVGGVEVTVFYIPEQGDNGPALLRYTSETIEWGAERLGGYPYLTLHVAVVGSNDPAGVGQEYPTLYFISNQVASGPSNPGSYLNYIATHETLHQWFYSQVGIDQVNEPWIDEGLAVMLTYEYYEDLYPSLYDPSVAGVRRRLDDAISTYGEMPLDTPIQDYVDETHYFAMLYRRATVFYLEVEALMGESEFFEALRNVVSQSNQPRLVSGDQVLSAFARRAPVDEFKELVGEYFRAVPETLPEPTPTVEHSPSPDTAVDTPRPTPSILPDTPSPTAGPVEQPVVTPTSTQVQAARATQAPVATPTSVLIVLATATGSAAATHAATATPVVSTPTPSTVQTSPTSFIDIDFSSPITLGVAVIAAFVIGFGATAMVGRRR